MGYMATGKSTIGKIVGPKLGVPFMDLDRYIEEKEQRSIAEMFKTEGEIYFRKQEAYYLSELTRSKEGLVLSLGGGTPCYGTNMQDMINDERVTTIYLKASISTIVARLKNEQAKRPLIAHLKSDQDMEDFVAKHLFDRSPFYNQADIVINTDGKTVEEVCDDLISKLS
jgi:shikimate kinase